MQYFELKIPPLALWVVFAAAIATVGHYAPSASVQFPGHQAVSITAVFAAIVIGAAAIMQFRKALTTVSPLVPSRASAIVSSGVFRFSRNPMYLAMAVSLIGIAAWRSSLSGYFLVPFFCLYVTAFQIKPEERALKASFGDEYLAYMAKVRRWM